MGFVEVARASAAFGRARTNRVARWLREKVSGLAGNVSLGFLLGMTPALGHAFGLSALRSAPFWWASRASPSSTSA